ncbi:MAG: maleylacetate reductase, partial [Pseudomonadota bacterium]
MRSFACALHPVRVRFGTDMNAAIAEEANRLELTRLIVLSTPPQADAAAAVADGLGARVAGRFVEAATHMPVEVTEPAVALAREVSADGLVSFGGGSTTGLSKAIAHRTGLRQIAVPTTYAGSEATPILGQIEGGRKTTLRDPRVLPDVIVYDVTRTMSLPQAMTMTSGLNALAHAVAARQAPDANPISGMMAAEGIRAMVPALRTLADDPRDADARSDALYAAWMCGSVLGQVTMSLHHKLCHNLGGSFDLPHAETHSVVLPHATAFNADAVGEGFAGLAALARDLGAPTALRDLGMPE